MKDKVYINVDYIKDEGLMLEKEYKEVNVVKWNEEMYEKKIIERNKDECDGKVDIVIDFGKK